jgi:subtilisin family serine protease
MVKRKERKETAATPAASEGVELPELPVVEGSGWERIGPETTGRYIVVFKDQVDPRTVQSTLHSEAGLKAVPASNDYEEGAISSSDLAESEVVHFSKLGIAMVSGPEAVHGLATAASNVDSPILVIEPEYISYLSSPPRGGLSLEYLRGYRDALINLYDAAAGTGVAPGMEAEARAILGDTPQFTWGLQATGASTSQHNGQGIKVAVLDTGMDLQHPDFGGRAIVSRAFARGINSAQDLHGHGTHCVGTACGPQRPATGVRRYGIASGAQILVGKVFNNNPRPGAATGDVIAGIEWALTMGCRVVSLSLGIPINQPVAQYETPIRRALDLGTLVVAAAGNNANRPGLPGFDQSRPPTSGFVEPPANAQAAMAVAAIDSQMRIASFSARSSAINGVGGIVNIAAPGVAVFSSVPVARGGHALLDGTSMATPHVAGVAALWAQAAGLSGSALWNKLVQTVRPLNNLAAADVGAGLAQVPQ